MARIRFENVSKAYPDGHVAVDRLNLEISDGEFMVLVGPSGCGKSTALRMVAGLEDISDGLLMIGDEPANDLAPRERNVAMIFQSYALYPHLSVEQNMGFALKVRGMAKTTISEKVRQAAHMLELQLHTARKPGQLSGGQRQRVAMGRAIVRQPTAFLMDEPLSNLDARLRGQMRAEVARLQRESGVTTIYVTHDQVEAMTMGDRVAVMNRGVLQQLGPPRELYDRPRNAFVATFIGSPPINLLKGQLVRERSGVVLEIGSASLVSNEDCWSAVLAGADKRTVIVGLRPEAMKIETEGAGVKAGLHGSIAFREDLGSHLLMHVSVDAERAKDPSRGNSDDEMDDIGNEGKGATVRVNAPAFLQTQGGDQVVLSVDTGQIHFFDFATGDALGQEPVSR